MLSVFPDFKNIEDAVSKAEPASMRLNVLDLKDGRKLIDDSYNASPLAMRSSLDFLASFHAKKKAAVLGDMLELGDESEKFHRELGEYLSGLDIDLVICVGREARNISCSGSFLF